jgi:hypothetical protein
VRIPVRTLDIKSQLLQDVGYAYSFDRRIYVNLSARKTFSFQFIENNREDELRKCISEKTGGGEWQFYFTSPPPDGVRRELESVLGMAEARAD